MSISNAISTLGRPVAYYPNIARWLGGDVSAAVFLCQFMYWRKQVGDRQIYKSRPDIEAETGLSERVQKRVCTLLKARKYVDIVKKGMPARNFYAFDWKKIDTDFADWSALNVPTSEYQTSPLVGTDGADKKVPNDPTTSETTTEITTEITTEEKSNTRAAKKKKIADSTVDIGDGTSIPVNTTRYQRLCRDYGEGETKSYMRRAYNYAVSVKGDEGYYKDFAAAAEVYMTRDGVKKRPPMVQSDPEYDAWWEKQIAKQREDNLARNAERAGLKVAHGA